MMLGRRTQTSGRARQVSMADEAAGAISAALRVGGRLALCCRGISQPRVWAGHGRRALEARRPAERYLPPRIWRISLPRGAGCLGCGSEPNSRFARDLSRCMRVAFSGAGPLLPARLPKSDLRVLLLAFKVMVAPPLPVPASTGPPARLRSRGRSDAGCGGAASCQPAGPGSGQAFSSIRWWWQQQLWW